MLYVDALNFGRRTWRWCRGALLSTAIDVLWNRVRSLGIGPAAGTGWSALKVVLASSERPTAMAIAEGTSCRMHRSVARGRRNTLKPVEEGPNAIELTKRARDGASRSEARLKPVRAAVTLTDPVSFVVSNARVMPPRPLGSRPVACRRRRDGGLDG